MTSAKPARTQDAKPPAGDGADAAAVLREREIAVEQAQVDRAYGELDRQLAAATTERCEATGRLTAEHARRLRDTLGS